MIDISHRVYAVTIARDLASRGHSQSTLCRTLRRAHLVESFPEDFLPNEVDAAVNLLSTVDGPSPSLVSDFGAFDDAVEAMARFL